MKKSSRDFSARDMSMTNTFDTANFSKNNEYETKNFYGENNTGDDPVLFTDPVYSNSGILHVLSSVYLWHTYRYIYDIFVFVHIY
jgi:hypothetical protein